MAKAYERIADELRQSIRTGRLRPGDQLPAETRLAEQSGRSVPTVRDALRLLQAEGLIEKVHGRGSFVRRARTRVQRTNARHQWEKDRARQPHEKRAQTGATEHDTGLEVDDLVFRAAYREITADEDIAAAMGIAEGTVLVERTYRTRYSAERAPLSLVTSYLVRERIESNPDLLDETKEPWPGGTWNQLHTVGVEIDRVEERVSARPPTAEEAEELDLPPGTAVLVLRKTLVDTGGLIAEMSDVTLPGDRTETLFTTHLERW
ncbi:GntR family transcriptional regulator [Streptomyces sp. NPDC090052]|uniref:GntR family transcriptional regulator n=1 Tax=unclassified Streptomyces TaxID=2593676 RepID=UPI0022508827|nr:MULTISPECIES: GntR family transcriptional regulator [unclassified Streptomyces]MCX4724898.1 GntR family transcriptional regulator [Streptomyces sp. NBC_01306]WSV05629.1 GntR family transcriptional regulator [Streptomyces sp. NBC_01020]WSX68266.1 GntR family transcriptional regulator [Streptomyces sp. NBC_00932]